MKRYFLVIIVIVVLMLPACQKAQETPKPKTVAAQAVKQIPLPQPQPQSQPQQTQPAKEITTQQVKFGQFTSTEKTVPLTESEQKYIEGNGGFMAAPDLQFKGKNVLKYLRILVKGNPKTIRFYQEWGTGMTEKQINSAYGEAIGEAFARLNPKEPEIEDLAKQILKTKQNYKDALGYAINALGYSGDKSVIPLLREFLNFPDESIQAVAAGALLKLGDGDTALPVIKRLDAVSYLADENGRLYDKRGKDILVGALSDQRAEVAMVSAMILFKIGIEKDKCEEAALNVIKRLINKKEKDYGYEVIGGLSNPQWVLLPAYKNKDLNKLEQNFSSDMRACSYAMTLLGKLRSKKAVPLLEYIKNNNTAGGCVCWENAADRAAEHALEKIEGGK